MGSHIIIGLPRTGTSFLNDLVQHQFNCWNLGESWSIRGLSDLSEIDIRTLKKDTEFNTPILYDETKLRLSYLNDNVNKNWVLKIWPEFCLTHKKILDTMYESDVTILMVHRKNIEQHFISWLNSMYRSNKSNQEYNYFNVNTNSHMFKDIKYEIFIPENAFQSFFEYFCNCLLRWRLTYEIFKEKITIVSFEDHINLLNMKHIGIDEETIKRYNEKEVHFVPTPYNSENFLQKKMFLKYKHMLNDYKYLLEI